MGRAILAVAIIGIGLSLPAVGQTPVTTPADRLSETIDRIRSGASSWQRRYILAGQLPMMVAEVDRTGGVDAGVVDQLLALLDGPEAFIRESSAYSLGALRPKTDRVISALWRAQFQERLRMDCDPPDWVGFVPRKCETFSIDVSIHTPLAAMCTVLISIGEIQGDPNRSLLGCIGAL